MGLPSIDPKFLFLPSQRVNSWYNPAPIKTSPFKRSKNVYYNRKGECVVESDGYMLFQECGVDTVRFEVVFDPGLYRKGKYPLVFEVGDNWSDKLIPDSALSLAHRFGVEEVIVLLEKYKDWPLAKDFWIYYGYR